MSLNLHLYRVVGSVKQAKIDLWQVPTDVSLQILPTQEAQGLQPTLAQYLAWIQQHCAGNQANAGRLHGLNIQLSALQTTLVALRNCHTEEEDIQSIKDDIQAVEEDIITLSTSNSSLHERALADDVAQAEAQFPDGRWVWRVG